MNWFRRFRDAAIVAALVAVPFFFLKANLTAPEETNWLDELVLQGSAPIQWVATEVSHGVSAVIEEYVWLVDVRGDNERLRAENARLRQEAAELQREAAENIRLRELLALREQLGGEVLTAQVIGKEVSRYFRVVRVRLDRGERDFVREGMPVVSSEGLVGQIRRTAGRYSDVLLTVDQTSAVDVVIGEGGARGTLVGTGDDARYLCQVEDLERTEELAVGDEVYTSGYGRRFPAAILVGYVREIRREEFGLFQEVEVEPAVDFSRLEEVLVLTAGSRERAVVERTRTEEEL
ncbi:MAG: rod shape-determining protein MreC [Myxococcota bacterium]